MESFQVSFLKRINSEIEVVASKYKRTDKPKFKDILKTFKKRIIAKLVKENYDDLMRKYFPHLADIAETTTDLEFERKFYNTPEIWENMERNVFEQFLFDIDSVINYFADRNHSEMGNLAYLKRAYLKY